MTTDDTGPDIVAPAPTDAPADARPVDDAPTPESDAPGDGPDPDEPTPAAAPPAPAPAPAEMPDDAIRLAGLIRSHAERTGATRIIVGLTGGPGSGKSTTAARLLDEFTLAGERAAVVPMDGFHLAQRQLQAQGLADIKGAPETFDAEGYLALLHRLRTQRDEVVYAPAFDRTLEEPVAGSIAVAPDVRYVITEGNYLLHDVAPWPAVRAVLDAVWFLDPGEDIRINRLVRRHIQFGRTPNAALKRATTGVDAVNAELIAPTRQRADLVITS
ncbi:nucleoside/nucleotide kinase family protein [Nakamurella deserti]|uniref:nucleoside/nucleotide kinase family protein n=1 Tax=Nakamurella deserti TaxID=2164074 RepID=UPI001F0CB41B|nr:nucleoside/nucleotide kinase family protein [Nakamurella deserti]